MLLNDDRHHRRGFTKFTFVDCMLVLLNVAQLNAHDLHAHGHAFVVVFPSARSKHRYNFTIPFNAE